MSVFSNMKEMFRNKEPTEARQVSVKVVSERDGFYSWDGRLYDSDVIRSCISPKARAIAKHSVVHIRNGPDGMKENPEIYMKELLRRPNPLMSMQMLLEKMIIQLELSSNAFARIFRDARGFPVSIYPIVCSSMNSEIRNGRLYIQFYMSNGKAFEEDYQNLIHIRRDFGKNDVFGESRMQALTKLMDVVSISDQGIIKAIKNSNVISWILKFKTVLQKKDKDEIIEQFTEEYLSTEMANKNAVVTDTRYEAEQVSYSPYVPNAAQTDRSIDRIYNIFGTNKKIVQGSYTEDEWNAYYEAQIEPEAKQIAEEFTSKLFSKKEIAFGNKISISGLSLQYASMSSKLGLWQMVDRGAMTPNEWRLILNMPAIEGGDKPIRRLDTAEVGGEKD